MDQELVSLLRSALDPRRVLEVRIQLADAEPKRTRRGAASLAELSRTIERDLRSGT